MKTCSNCKQEKSFAEYNKSKNHRHGLHPFCKECRAIKTKEYMKDPIRNQRNKARAKKWREENPERAKILIQNWNRFHLYGLTPEQHQEMLERQDYRCLSCKEEKPLVVDHNHETGEVRALICQRCNIAVGFVENGAAKLAENYLQMLKSRV